MQHAGIDSFNTTWYFARGLHLQFHYSVYRMSRQKGEWLQTDGRRSMAPVRMRCYGSGIQPEGTYSSPT